MDSGAESLAKVGASFDTEPLFGFRAYDLPPEVRGMHRRKSTRAETLIERIYREVNGYKMPRAIKRILLPKRTVSRKSR